MRQVLQNHIKAPFPHCANALFHIYIMSYRPSKRAKKAPETVQRGAHIETSTSRGIRSRNVGIAPAPGPSVGTGREHTQRDGQRTNVPSLNAPDHMDFFVPTEEEVRTAHGKVVYFLSSRLIVHHSGLDAK
jgi:hypothetical protein